MVWRCKGRSMIGRRGCLVLRLVRSRLGNRNAVGDVVTQGEGFLQGKGPKRSGVGVAGLKPGGLVARKPAGL